MKLKDKIVQLLQGQVGLTDREITDLILARGAPQQGVNIACRALEVDGTLARRKEDGRIRNYLVPNAHQFTQSSEVQPSPPTAASDARTGSIDRLLKIGFQLAGRWVLRDALPICDILADAPTSPNVLYAFVTDSVVRCVGKTTQGLRKRLYGYQKPGQTQRTNLRNHDEITTALSNGEQVDIYVMPDSGLHAIGEFTINLAAGLEDSIIKKLKPEWNC